MEQIKMLPIDKALALYDLLKPHLPEDKEREFLDLIEKIIDSMKESNPATYVHCLQLLSGLELNDFEKINSIEAFSIFFEGLMENNVLGLISFCENLGL